MLKLLKDWLERHFSDPQMVILGFLLVLGFVFIFYLGEMLAPVLAALVIAYLLDGMASALQRLKMPRLAAVLIVFLIFLAALVVILVGLLPLISRQIAQLVQMLPSMAAGIQKQLILLPEKYPDFVSAAQVNRILEFLTSEITGLAQNLLSLSLASVKGIIAILVYLILVPLLVFFFLKDKELLLAWATSFLPEHRGLATAVWRDVNIQIGNYVRGKVWEILIVWGVSYATFSFINLEFAMLLALFTGLSVLIPYIGATIMFLPIILISFFQWGLGTDFAYAVIAYSIIQALDGNLLVPLLLSGVVNLHPVAIIMAVLVFGGLWGVWGLFFAIPLATLAQALLKTWFNHRADSRELEAKQEHPKIIKSANN